MKSLCRSALPNTVMLQLTLCLISSAPVTAAYASLVIADQATQGVSCYSDVCIAVAENGVINVNDITSQHIQRIYTENVTDDIVFASPIANLGSLALYAARSVVVNSKITFSANKPRVIFQVFVNQGHGGGSFYLGENGKVVFPPADELFSVNKQHYYLFASIAELQYFAAKYPSGHLALARSISAKSTLPYAAVVPGVFAGTLDGLGNSISLLSISGNGGSTGLFAQLGQPAPSLGALSTQAIVSNLHLQVNLATTDGSGGGALAGTAYNTTLNNVTVAGKVMATQRANGGMPLGGIIGTMSGGGMFNCVNHASVTSGPGAALVGGLVGAAGRGLVINGSLSTGAVSGGVGGEGGSMGSVGGLLGSASGVAIVNSLVTGSVIAVGGLAGGLVGADDDSMLQTSYVNAPVTDEYSTETAALIGRTRQVHPLVTDVYFDRTVTGPIRAVGDGGSIGNVGLSKAELAAGLPAGFDPSIWTQTAGVYQGLPYLIALPPP